MLAPHPVPCQIVQALLAPVFTELDDDPSGPPARRWVWEAGAEYAVAAADPGLEGFLSWRLHVLGPERSRVPDTSVGVGFFLAPPDPSSAPPESSLVVVGSPGADGELGTPDDALGAVAYGVEQPADTDEDGVPDAEDNCPTVANESQLDADDDSFGNACDCDFNQDGACGQPDYSTFIACFGALVPTSGPDGDPTCEESDMNGDGAVGQPDYSLFISRFGGTPGP